MEEHTQTYDFDCILKKSTLKRIAGQPSPFSYMISPYKDYFELREDRIQSADFPPTPLTRFVANPYELAASLTSRGIRVAIYESGQILGCGCLRPNDDILRPLTEPTFSANGSYTVDVEQDQTRVARIDLDIKFSSADPKLNEQALPFGCYDICRTYDKSINPRDLIFLLGRSKTSAVATAVTDTRLMSFPEDPFSCLHKAPSLTGCGCVVRGTQPFLPSELDRSKQCERALLDKLLIELEYDKMIVPSPPPEHELSRQFNSSRKFNYPSYVKCRPCKRP